MRAKYFFDKWESKFKVDVIYRKERLPGLGARKRNLRPAYVKESRLLTLQQMLSPKIFRKYKSLCVKKFGTEPLYFRVINAPPYGGLSNWERDYIRFSKEFTAYFNELFAGTLSEGVYVEVKRIIKIKKLRVAKTKLRVYENAQKYRCLVKESILRRKIMAIGDQMGIQKPLSMSLEDVEKL